MKTVCLGIALILSTGAVSAQDAPSSVRGEILQQLGNWENQTVSLAEAAPADLFDWRPAEGVRSFGEAILHMSGAMYYMLRMMGSPPPEGVNLADFEATIRGKDAVVNAAKAAFTHARNSIMGMSDAQLEETTEWFFEGDITYRGFLTFMNAHSAEHLGQLIAYGRMNGLVPPWSN